MDKYMPFQFLFVLLLCISYSKCDVRVLSAPSNLIKDFTGDDQSKMNLYPRTFNVTSQLVLSDPETGCEPLKNLDQVKGNIVLVTEGGNCWPSQRQKNIADAGGVGMIQVATTQGKGAIGFLYYFGGKPDPDTYLPSINIKEAEDLLEALHNDPNIVVIVNMESTDNNPWLRVGQGAAGIIFQIYFEIIAFITLIIGVYKLSMVIKYKGLHFTVTQICLSLEIVCSIFRILWMMQPLSWYNYLWSNVADTFVLGYSNNLSFTTDLLITFYWQEILLKCDKKLSNKVLNNLDRLKIPFIIVISIVWILDTIASLGRVHKLGPSGANAFMISAIINVIFLVCIATFFLTTSIKILKLTSGGMNANRKTRRISRLMLTVVISGFFLVLCILGPILFISPAGSSKANAMIPIFWIWYTGLWGVSLSKVCMFETPHAAASSFDSGSSGKTSTTIGMTSVSKEGSLSGGHSSENTVV